MSYERDKNVAELKALWDEPNPNRESQQEYFGYGRVVHTNPQNVKVYNMNDDNRFGNNNQNNANIIQAQIRQAQSLEQLHHQQRQQMDPCYICRQKEEDLKRQVKEAADTTSKLLGLKRDSEIEILQLKLEVAQLKLALAKAEK